MRFCPQCNSQFLGAVERCPIDGTPLQEQADSLIGRVVGGRYRIQARVAEGGMASIYKARQEQLERTVAVKVLSRMLSEDPIHKERFLREARAANRIHHENVIDVTDFGETEDGLVYLVMEYLEGESLADVVTRGPVTLSRATEVLHPVCLGLQRAHELGILHRDIKPENIYLERRHDGGENVKLLDFGLAQLLGDKRLTTAGQVFGTPEYLSPEQAMGTEVTPRADLYALGVVFYEMLTGRLPFTGSTARLIYQHLHELPKPPSQVRPELPAEVDELVLKLLRKEPAERFGSAREFDEALAACERRLASKRHTGQVSTIRTAASEILHFPADLADKYASRLAAARERWEQAGPRRNAAVGRDLERLQGAIEALQRAQAELERTDREFQEFLEHGRGTLDRLRRAVDELTQDEARARREIEGLRTALARAHAEAQDAEREFAETRAQLARPQREDAAGVGAAIAFETAGKAARRWRDAAAERESIERDLAAKNVELEEVRFQLGQFRGRIAALEVDAARSKDDGATGDAAIYRRRLRDAQRLLTAQVDEAAKLADSIERRLIGAS
jgi:serine/threonine-protein kinase